MRSQALAALVGAVVAGGIVLLVGTGSTHKTTTVYQQAPLRSAADKSGALTAREIYRRSAPGVVQVKAQIVQRVQSPFDLFPMEQRGLATGSGFTVDKKGDILTNAHVIQGAVRVTVQFGHRTASARPAPPPPGRLRRDPGRRSHSGAGRPVRLRPHSHGGHRFGASAPYRGP